ncbi:MAG: N-acyl-D-aspartate/D-glutamate deacylase [Gammaproteobacteria bacterium]|jgi:N-acyl-D-aspartate/D-glutamate deacylase
MPTHYDLIVRNGTVVDGTGAAPFAADVAIKDGVIVAVGQVDGSASKEIDAAGKLVTPGFVDIHTHYDAQAVWDSHLAPSSLHGVTTVVMGNCGVGFAPCRPQDRDKLIELMEGVEDIPGAVMHEGLEWTWESFPEYLDALEKKPRDVDVCALLPHSAVRVNVMGDRAVAFEPATPEDIAKMRAITKEAVEAGAFGVSTSRTTSHKTLAGDYIPTLRVYEDELMGLAEGLNDAGSGFIEAVSDWITDESEDTINAQPDPVEAFGILKRVAQNSGRPMVYTLAQRNSLPEMFDRLLEMNRHAYEKEGVNIRPVFPPRAIGILLGLQASQTPFSGCPTFKPLNDLPLAEKVAKLRDPQTRAQILSEDPKKDATFPLLHRLSYTRMFLFQDKNYQPQEDQSIASIAQRGNRSEAEVAYDMLTDNDGKNFLYTPVTNYSDFSLSASEKLLGEKMAIMGLGDGGAHVGFILDAGFPTWLLTHWGKNEGKFATPELVRRLTSDTAQAAGLGDRGRVKVGLKGDLNIIDWDALDFETPYVVQDLPAGGKRLMQGASGYSYTIVSGEVTHQDGTPTGVLPGKLVRGQRPDPALLDMAAE